MSDEVRDLVLEYGAAAGKGRSNRLGELVHPDARLGGTVKEETHGRDGVALGDKGRPLRGRGLLPRLSRRRWI
jgi:hypothetical protein